MTPQAPPVVDRYALEERAAILEHDAGMTREEAERAVGLREVGVGR